MKTVLVNVPAEHIVETRYDQPDYPHPGLGYLAAYLLHKNKECSIVDAKLERLCLADFLDKLRQIGPDIVGFTAMTHEIEHAAYVASLVKEALPHCYTVVGGVHLTALPDETLRNFPGFDFGISGEGERVLWKLVDALQIKGDLSNIKGIVFRKNGKICLNALQDKIENMDDLPFPAWEQFPRAREYPIMTGRGCPFDCIFCMNPNGKKVRFRSPGNVWEEFKLVVDKYRPKRIVFWDETFTLNNERINKILDRIISSSLNRKVRWYAQTHAACISYELLKKMRRAGCIKIGLGIESGNERILASLRKGITLREVIDSVSLAKKVGLPVEGYFILGHPNETFATAQDTIKFASRLNPEYPVFGIMVPYPGTEVWRMAKNGESGYKIVSLKWSDYNKQLGNALELANLNRHQLEYLQLRGYLSVFIVNLRLVSLAKFIFKYRREGLAFLKKILLGKR